MKSIRPLILLSVGAIAPLVLSSCHSTHYSAYGGVSSGGYGVAPLYSGSGYYGAYYPSPWYRTFFRSSRRHYAYPVHRGYAHNNHDRKGHPNNSKNHPNHRNGSRSGSGNSNYDYYASRGNNGTTRTRASSRSTPTRSVAPATRRSTSNMMGKPQARTASLRSAAAAGWLGSR